MEFRASSSRIEYIDLIRGIGILLMIMGHVGFGEMYDRYCNAFHMPLFFFVSGYFYSAKISIGKLLKKKTAALVVPYISYSILSMILSAIIEGRGFNLTIFLMKVLFPQKTIPYVGSIWFLAALFICEILYKLLDETLHSLKKVTVAVVLIAILGHIEAVIGHILPLEAGAAFIGIVFYHVARGIREYQGNATVSKSVGIVIVMVLVISTYFQKDWISMSGGSYGIIPLFWFNAFGWICVIWAMSKELCMNENKNKLKKTVISQLKYMGRNSVSYVALNTLILEMVRYYFAVIDIKMLRRAAELIAVIVLVTLLDVIIRKTALRYFLVKYPV